MSSPTPDNPLPSLPEDELHAIAEDLGLDPRASKSRQHLLAALSERQQMIAAMDRDAMLDVVKWGRRPVPANASKEELARQIVQIKLMRFEGLSERGLVVLAFLRNIDVRQTDNAKTLAKKLKKKEGLFARLNRAKRAWVGKIVSNMLGGAEAAADYQFLPPQQDPSAAATSDNPNLAQPQSPNSAEPSIQQEIEESGLFGGLASRIKRSADTYLNQKLDEIEARIDRKLDEIDRRLGEWRDKEVSNRLKILKITLWVSVIVAAVSLIYSYMKVYLPMWMGGK